MAILSLVFLIAALICLGIAAFWNPNPPVKPHFGWLGLAFLALSDLIIRVLAAK